MLLAVFFNEDLDVQEIWSIPCEVVKEASFVAVTDYAGASFSHLEPPKIIEDRPSRH